MNTPDVQYISDDRGDLTGVIVPILFWKEILSELETHHVLGSEVMRKRLLEALERKEGIPFDEVLAKLDLE